jgi:putative flippase GtrA
MTLLTLLKNLTSIKVFILAGFTYFIAITLDYLLLRVFVYKNSIRSNYKGYFYFLLIALSGSGMVSIVMYYFVEVLGYYYLLVRPLFAIVLGIWNYTLNTSLNFRR